MSRFYITTAIPYANGAPHIGHAYERIATDAIQRFMRLDGRETLFVTGMDEYGLKVQQTAAREGVTPQAFVDRIAAEFEAMGDAPERARRRHRPHDPTAPRPRRAGDLGAHARPTATSTCRNIPAGTRCATKPISTRANSPTAPTGRSSRRAARRPNGSRRRATSSASRPMPTSCSRITRPIPTSSRRRSTATRSSPSSSAASPIFRSAARRLDWGVPVPGDPKHVMYVWVDALTNYITATGFPDDAPARQVLAGRRACDRQGHHPLPLPSTGRPF